MFKTNALNNVANEYVDRNDSISQPGTRIEADDQNIKQQEIVNAVEGTSQTLDASGVFTNNDQLLNAILFAAAGGISGLVISNDAVDTDHDIEISIGTCLDSTKAKILRLTTAITKQIDAVWSAGDDAGGLFSGATLTADTEYPVFIIENDTTLAIDAGFDDNLTASNRPAGWTKYRRVGFVKTDGSANIIGFRASEIAGGGLDVDYNAFQSDLNASIGTTRTLLTVTAPVGTKAKIACEAAYDAANASIWIMETDFTDVIPNIGLRDMITSSASQEQNIHKQVYVDSNNQIAYRSSATVDLRISVTGYIDDRC